MPQNMSAVCRNLRTTRSTGVLLFCLSSGISHEEAHPCARMQKRVDAKASYRYIYGGAKPTAALRFPPPINSVPWPSQHAQ